MQLSKGGHYATSAGLLDFAVKVAGRSQEISEADLNTLADQGFSQDGIWDAGAGAIAAPFALSNRLATMATLQPNAKFYQLGGIKHDISISKSNLIK